MVKSARQAFNEAFTEEKYRAFLSDLHPTHDLSRDFRVAETPVFVDKALKRRLLDAFAQIGAEIASDRYRECVRNAVPRRLHLPGEDDHPCFVAIDFAIVRDEDGALVPRLIEMQGVASLYCYQRHLNEAYARHYPVPDGFTPYLIDGLDASGYVGMLRELILGQEDPEQVVLMDIHPEQQKTRIDFHYTERDLGVKAVSITDVRQEGDKLYYLREGKRVPIRRIYNRVIFDELERRMHELDVQFELTADLDVQWFAHPNWFYKVSKYGMPFLRSEYVPETRFLSEVGEYPLDLENYVLKPLFSFAGAGLVFDLDREALDRIVNRENYILQRKVQYEPVVETLDIPAKVEIRLLCLWGEELLAPLSLSRLSKGKIIGVDFNKDKTWVGGSAVFYEV